MLNIDLLKRFENKTFVISFIGVLIVFLKLCKFADLIPKNYADIITAGFGLLAMFGILIDPTNSGISDYNKTARSSKPIYIVIHDTGDAGATAQNEHDYFDGGDKQASVNFLVDSTNIIQIIDTDNNYSWRCGDGHGAYGI